MIREIIEYLSHKPLLKEAIQFGHLSQSISLLAREKRCRNSWLPHRLRCIQFIKNQIHNAFHYESVLVLGSGPLHEIPIEYLCQTFKKVVLVDIVHLKSTKRKLKSWKNIEFIEHDISEIEDLLMKKKELIHHSPSFFLKENWGLLLSINLMSQLPIHLNSYIKKKIKHKFSEEQIRVYLDKVCENHLHYLYSFNCPALLITDVETIYSNQKEETLETERTFPNLFLPKCTDEWIWNIAPIPEYHKKISIRMRVLAFVIKK